RRGGRGLTRPIETADVWVVQSGGEPDLPGRLGVDAERPLASPAGEGAPRSSERRLGRALLGTAGIVAVAVVTAVLAASGGGGTPAAQQRSQAAAIVASARRAIVSASSVVVSGSIDS